MENEDFDTIELDEEFAEENFAENSVEFSSISDTEQNSADIEREAQEIYEQLKTEAEQQSAKEAETPEGDTYSTEGRFVPHPETGGTIIIEGQEIITEDEGLKQVLIDACKEGSEGVIYQKEFEYNGELWQLDYILYDHGPDGASLRLDSYKVSEPEVVEADSAELASDGSNPEEENEKASTINIDSVIEPVEIQAEENTEIQNTEQSWLEQSWLEQNTLVEQEKNTEPKLWFNVEQPATYFEPGSASDSAPTFNLSPAFETIPSAPVEENIVNTSVEAKSVEPAQIDFTEESNASGEQLFNLISFFESAGLKIKDKPETGNASANKEPAESRIEEVGEKEYAKEDVTKNTTENTKPERKQELEENLVEENSREDIQQNSEEAKEAKAKVEEKEAQQELEHLEKTEASVDITNDSVEYDSPVSTIQETTQLKQESVTKNSAQEETQLPLIPKEETQQKYDNQTKPTSQTETVEPISLREESSQETDVETIIPTEIVQTIESEQTETPTIKVTEVTEAVDENIIFAEPQVIEAYSPEISIAPKQADIVVELFALKPESHALPEQNEQSTQISLQEIQNAGTVPAESEVIIVQLEELVTETENKEVQDIAVESQMEIQQENVTEEYEFKINGNLENSRTAEIKNQTEKGTTLEIPLKTRDRVEQKPAISLVKRTPEKRQSLVMARVAELQKKDKLETSNAKTTSAPQAELYSQKAKIKAVTANRAALEAAGGISLRQNSSSVSSTVRDSLLAKKEIVRSPYSTNTRRRATRTSPIRIRQAA